VEGNVTHFDFLEELRLRNIRHREHKKKMYEDGLPLPKEWKELARRAKEGRGREYPAAIRRVLI
jgi:hypothetical protein